MLLIAAILATLDDPFYDPPEHLVKYETPQQRRSYTAWASKLRDDLIGDDSGYDKVVPPRSDARSAGGDGWFTDEFSAAGTVVGLQIRFFKVESVKASEGATRLKVWVRCKWQDSLILLSCLCLCLTWCVCHEVARRERLIDTAAKTRRRQMSSMDELRRQTSVDRLSTLAENSVEGSNPGEVAVEVRGDSGGTLKVSSAI